MLIEKLENQKKFFYKGITRDKEFRVFQLQLLKNSIKNHETALIKALKEDLNKGEFEAYAAEIGMVYGEIDNQIKNLMKWTKTKKYKSPVHMFGATSYANYEPKGVVLIVAPWNYPVFLVMTPLVASIASGNCTIVKPSEYTPNVAAVMENIISAVFRDEYITIIRGNREVLAEAIEQDFDHIFFTGSTNVGKIIMEKASKKLIPVTLELGGKSPCIVDETAKIDVAARRIVWGKLMNAGQTCIAPDYFLVHSDVKQEFIERVIYYIEKFYTDKPELSQDFCRIITKKHVERIVGLIKDAEVIYGGQYDIESKYFQPTILDNVKLSDPIMGEEIFGPIIPIIQFSEIEEVFEVVRTMPTPLALYIFTENKSKAKKVTENISFGGGCINDVLSHVSNHNMPFGGTGTSGVGRYHGKYSIRELSNLKSMVDVSTKIDLSVKYPPYNKRKIDIIRKLFK